MNGPEPAPSRAEGPPSPGWIFWWRQRLVETVLAISILLGVVAWFWPREGTLALQVEGLTSCGAGQALNTPWVAELTAAGLELASSSHGGASFGEAHLSIWLYHDRLRGGWARLRIGACPSWREAPHASVQCADPQWRIRRWVYLRPRGLDRPQRVRVSSAEWPCMDSPRRTE